MGQQTVKRILHKVNLNYFPTICIPNTYTSAMRLFQYLFPNIFCDLSNLSRQIFVFWAICSNLSHQDTQGSGIVASGLRQDLNSISKVFYNFFFELSLSVKTAIGVHNFIFDFILELSLSVKTSIVVLHNFIFDFIFELSLSVQTTIVLYFWLRRHEYIKNSSLIHVILPKVCKALNFWKSIISSSNVVEVYL